MIRSDPAVEHAGVEVGYTLQEDQLRAPDVSVLGAPPVPNEWATVAPKLALEIAGPGQDEADLRVKIGELLAGGTQAVWVIRGVSPRRVEVYRSGAPMELFTSGSHLSAPGVLERDIPVDAFYDAALAAEHTLGNLLRRFGYADVKEIREEGREEGVRTALRTVLEARGFVLDAAALARVDAANGATLTRWLIAAATATSLEGALGS